MWSVSAKLLNVNVQQVGNDIDKLVLILAKGGPQTSFYVCVERG